MALTTEQLEKLNQPLNVSAIKHRPGGGGRQLKYIKGDTAMDVANHIFGFGQWGYKIIARNHQVIEDEKKGRIEFYTADIELSVVGAAFTLPGDGVGIVNAPFTVEMHEKAYKEASTDALKRALRHYGDQFGLSLYDEDDYVEAADGSLVQVKEVKPNQAQRPKQIVDARATQQQIAAPRQSQAISSASEAISTQAATASLVRSRVAQIKPSMKKDGAVVAMSFEDFYTSTVKKPFESDDAITPQECERMARQLDAILQARKNKAS